MYPFELEFFLYLPHSSGYMPRSRIIESYGNSSFSFLRNHHTVLHTGCDSLHSHQQCRKVPFSLHSLRHLSFVGFLPMPTATSIDLLHTLLGPQGRDESICQDPVHLTPTWHQALLTQLLKFLSESSVPLVSPATDSGSLPISFLLP